MPSTGDYVQLAGWQSKIAQDLAGQGLRANRPTQITPWGQSTWTEGPGGMWTQQVTLTPEQQTALESQQRLGLGRTELGEQLMGQVGEEVGAPIGWDALEANDLANAEAARDRAEEALYGRATSRLDPMWNQRQQAQETQLWNQGLRPGDEAWDTAMGNFNRARTDAYDTAMQQAIIGGGQEASRTFGLDLQRRQQAIGEQLRRRQVGLGDINALLGGQQVGMPQFPGFQRHTIPGQAYPALMQAGQAGAESAVQQYNAQQAQQQGLWGGLAGLGGAALGSPWFGGLFGF